MKIKLIERSFDDVMREYREKKVAHKKPIRPSIFFRTLMKLVSLPDLIATKFECERVGMERLGKKEPAFILMNHSSFIDLEIAASVLYPRPFNIVATTDGFVGKDWLMRQIGCIPTKKFVTDTALVRDMLHAVRKLGNSIVMYPEVGYSFDGRATTMPDTVGKCAKMLGIPLVVITTYGAFSRDPLYNNLQKRRVKVTAKMEYLLSPEEMKEMTDEQINKVISEHFAFDSFAWQRENRVRIAEDFRADGLNRVLYKCPHCLSEGKTVGKGIQLECTACGARYTLDEYGELKCESGEAKWTHIPDWYAWERREVEAELAEDKYSIDLPVRILAAVDTKHIYSVGDGRLTHTKNGFHLTGNDGQIDYVQKPMASYSVNADFNWYELGDIISVGDGECLYYCFPKVKGDIVAKIRLAAEEIYKLERKKRMSGIPAQTV